MQKITRALAIRSVNAGIIDVDDIEWFIFGIEKRFTAFITSAFFLVVGSYLSTPCIAVSYLCSFFFLRARTNGFHAKTFSCCLLVSIASEVLFLRFLLPIVTPRVIWVLNIVSISIILLVAPVNTTSIHMTRDELRLAKKYVHIRLLFLSMFLLLCRRMTDVLQGVTLGNTMTAVFLVIAIIEGENRHEISQEN